MRAVRQFAFSLACVSLLVLQPAHAGDKFPNRPVQWIVGFAAGGSNDVVARIFGEFLSNHLYQQFVIVNRSGSGGTIGAEVAINSPSC